MRNFKMTIEYDGTRYNGWQRQGNIKNTIQEKLETVLSRMAERPVTIHGSGRTDAGVHARGQVANFHLQTRQTPADILEYLNAYLPEDIGVTAVEEVPERFHSRLNAASKTYVYRIWNSPLPNVFMRRWMLSFPQKLDLSAMRRAAGFLLGTHDFMAFCANKRMKKSTIRTITQLDIVQDGLEVRITVRGSGFLYNMVRILCGTLLAVGTGALQPEEIPAILESKNRENAGETLPAKGLILWEVAY